MKSVSNSSFIKDFFISFCCIVLFVLLGFLQSNANVEAKINSEFCSETISGDVSCEVNNDSGGTVGNEDKEPKIVIDNDAIIRFKNYTGTPFIHYCWSSTPSCYNYVIVQADTVDASNEYFRGGYLIAFARNEEGTINASEVSKQFNTRPNKYDELTIEITSEAEIKLYGYKGAPSIHYCFSIKPVCSSYSVVQDDQMTAFGLPNSGYLIAFGKDVELEEKKTPVINKYFVVDALGNFKEGTPFEEEEPDNNESTGNNSNSNSNQTPGSSSSKPESVDKIDVGDENNDKISKYLLIGIGVAALLLVILIIINIRKKRR